jgi:hypothetical protein
VLDSIGEPQLDFEDYLKDYAVGEADLYLNLASAYIGTETAYVGDDNPEFGVAVGIVNTNNVNSDGIGGFNPGNLVGADSGKFNLAW